MTKSTIVKKATAPKKKTYVKKYPRYKRGYATGLQLTMAKRSELKYYDNTSSNIALLPNAPVFLGLCSVNNGTDDEEMIGSRIVVKSIWVKVYLNEVSSYDTYPAMTAGDELVRVMVVWDKQWNGASSLLPSDLLEDYSTVSFNPPFNVFSFINRFNKQRYEILHDEVLQYENDTYPMFNPGGAGSVQQFVPGKTKYHEKYLKCNIPIDSSYSTNKGLSDLKTNNLYVFIMCKNGIFGSCMVNTRIRFDDK